jgi:hypothetical protein
MILLVVHRDQARRNDSIEPSSTVLTIACSTPGYLIVPPACARYGLGVDILVSAFRFLDPLGFGI